MKFKTQHFLTGTELAQAELQGLLMMAEEARLNRARGPTKDLAGQTIALVFEKPSLRTRASFTVATREMGGDVLLVESQSRKTEEPEDSIRVLAGYCHGAMVRTFEHSVLERMTKVSPIPIINGLSDEHHPCQAIADLQTLVQSYGENLAGLKLGYVGDGNNVLASLLLMAPVLGVEVHYACPVGHGPQREILRDAQARALHYGGRIVEHAYAVDAVRGAQAVYTDVWTSMGFEAKFAKEAAARDARFAPFKLDEALYSHADKGALIMHCMPVVRDKEIASALIEHPSSALFRQSENRMHAQKALLKGLLGARARSDRATDRSKRRVHEYAFV